MTINRNVGEDRVLQDNLTRLVGKHSIKVGYEMIWTLYSDKAAVSAFRPVQLRRRDVPSVHAEYGHRLRRVRNGRGHQRHLHAAAGIFLPRLWDHELYFQDDWKVRPNLSLNLGLRWTYSSPFKTKYDQQSQFDPNAIDPVTGLMGAITHPKGIIGKRDLNNFQPRVGLSWNFHAEVGVPRLLWRDDIGQQRARAASKNTTASSIFFSPPATRGTFSC